MRGQKHSTLGKSKPSLSGQASRRAEIQRLERMSVEERILAALSLQNQLSGLRPTPLTR